MSKLSEVGASVSRLASLDAFRGFTIAAMVLVNNPGDWGNLYPQLAHAAWNGWTFTDWIFPFFLFIGGISMTMSLGRRAEAGDSKPALLWQLAKRAGIIFLIGLTLNFIPAFDISTVRIPGVLQRIALCTLLAAPIVVYCNWRQQVAVIIALFALYTVLMLFVAVPDVAGVVAAGVLEPGRDFGAYVDRLFLNGHLWAKVKTWDPEGIVSTLPALCSQLFGVLTGRWLSVDKTKAEKTVWMLLGGLLCLWVGNMIDATIMPINKSLWTVSYSIFITGWGLIVFGAFYWLMDACDSDKIKTQAAKWFKPFSIYGMNALFIFAFSGLFGKMLSFIKFSNDVGVATPLKALIYAPFKALPLGAVNTSLLFAIAFNLAMFAVAWGMYKKRWFVKV